MSDWSEEQLKTVYNHDLRNVLGNLLGRVTAPKLSTALSNAQPYIAQMSDQAKTGLSYASLLDDANPAFSAEDKELKQTLTDVKTDVEQLMDDFEYGRALERIQECLVKVRIFSEG